MDCNHIRHSVDLSQIKHLITKNNFLERCKECNNSGNFQQLWLCLKCCNQACGRNNNIHALKHYNQNASHHCISINTLDWKIWCYECDGFIKAKHDKQLKKTIRFLKQYSAYNRAKGPSPSVECVHIHQAIDLTGVQKTIQQTGLLKNCMECTIASPDLWICLKCGNQACGRFRNLHALQHYKESYPECHAICLNMSDWRIWCYECNKDVEESNEKIVAISDFLKKMAVTKVCSTKCTHFESIDFPKLKDVIEKYWFLENCPQCPKLSIMGCRLWLCLKCGHQACGRSKNGHAFEHFNKPQSKLHCLYLDMANWEVWCNDCDNYVIGNKALFEAVQYLKLERNDLEILAIGCKMADAVKKSRIVSDDDNLEEALLEEFNLRLKNCMSQDDLQKETEPPEPDDIYENINSPKKVILDTNNFLRTEIEENYYEVPKGTQLKNGAKENGHKHEEEIYESIPEKTDTNLDQNYIQMVENKKEVDLSPQKSRRSEEYEPMGLEEATSNLYESVELTKTEEPPKKATPTLNLPTTCFTDYSEDMSPDKEGKCSVTARDRMLLSCDDTSTLLFTQTVTSPMLTPSEENIDFLKGFQRDNTISESTATNSSPPKDLEEKLETSETSPDVSENLEEEKNAAAENFYENTDFYNNTTPENMYENVNMEANGASNVEEEAIYEQVELENKIPDDEEDGNIYQNIEEALADDVIQKNRKSQDTDEGSLEEFIRYEKEVSESFLVNKERFEEDIEEEINDAGEETIQEFDNNEVISECEGDILEVIEDVCAAPYEQETVSTAEQTIVEPLQNGQQNYQESMESIQTSLDSVSESKEKIFSETYKELIYHQKSESNSNYYEKYTEVLTKNSKSHDSMTNREKDTESVPAEIVKNLKSQFQSKADGAEVVGIVRKVTNTTAADTKSANIINQIKTKFEGATDSGGGKTVVDGDTTEYSETIVETNAPGEKCIKKKKVKKTRKEEKENISVTENGQVDGENFYNVSVKNLCRSFGDLTKLEKDRNNRKNIDRMRTKSLTDMETSHYNNKTIENVFSGVSVRTLKERFNSAGTNTNNCNWLKGSKKKSSFSKFDALQKKNVLHVRSSDSTKAQEKFSNGSQIELSTNCKSCGKQVFQMEQIKAERSLWHKNCFRCTECSKQLTVDTYESNDGSLYCKPHFRALFAPKAVEEDASPSDKPDLGLEELQSLNVKERFQVFEHYQQQTETSELEKGALNVKRSPSILSKLAKFQKHGMDIGVSNEALDGIPIEESESDEEEDDVPDGEDADLVRAKKVQKEKPFHFSGMSDVKKRWEQGDNAREERREETKQEIQNIRTRLFMGKQEKMKEAYQQAVMESESSSNLRKNISEKIEACDTKSIKERFEKGENVNEKTDKENRNEEEEVYESEISKKSRSLFLELDASASKAPQLSPVTPPKLEVKKAREAYLEKASKEDTVKSTETVEEVEVKTADIQERFKFFETYKEPEKLKKQFRITPPRDPSQVKTETPEREIYRDPDVARAEEFVDDSKIAQDSHTASKMLNKFRQMEESLSREPEIQGPKPLKCFTPPPEPTKPETQSEEDESSEYEEEEEETEEVDSNGKLPQDLIEAQKAARAKQLRAKFEKWEANEIKKEQNSINITEEYGEEQSQIESTRVLRARFEQMRDSSTETAKSARVKPNRFVEISAAITETCQSCNEKVYSLEKISIHGNIYHKSCFKCMECSCVLRMDSYSYNQGLFYCTPHFKRLFISKGNYDSAFGLDQHKEKWQNGLNNMTVA